MNRSSQPSGVEVGEPGPPAEVEPPRHPQAVLGGGVFEEAVSGVPVGGVGVVREVRHEEVRTTVLVEVAGVHPHARLRQAVHVVGGPGEQPLLLEPAFAVVDPQVVRHRVVRHIEVGVAVAVEVAGNHPEPVGGRRGEQSRRRCRVLEGPVAPVPEEAVLRRGQPRGAAEDREPEPDAARAGARKRQRLDGVGGVAEHEEVGVAIVFGVEERRRGGKPRMRRAACARDPREGPVAPVPEEHIAAQVRDMEIRKPSLSKSDTATP